MQRTYHRQAEYNLEERRIRYAMVSTVEELLHFINSEEDLLMSVNGVKRSVLLDAAKNRYDRLGVVANIPPIELPEPVAVVQNNNNNFFPAESYTTPISSPIPSPAPTAPSSPTSILHPQ